MMYLIKRMLSTNPNTGHITCVFYHSLTPQGIPLWVENRQDSQRLTNQEADRIHNYLVRHFSEDVVIE